MVFLIFILLIIHKLTTAEPKHIKTTEVFEIIVDSSLFNWTYEGDVDQFVYQPSLVNAPDLPSWINYVYSPKHHIGYLYGVPPNKNGDVTLEIVALNRKNYETRHRVFDIQVSEKFNPAKYEVQLKIDNLNIEDMFDVERRKRLRDIFTEELWKESKEDLYVTFLASAIKLGARLPLDPSEGEGVVLRLGSKAPLSTELAELQEEVRPLWKMPLCPRGFKRTTVERDFRDKGFALDWCAFRLLEDNSAMQHSQTNIEELYKVPEDKLIQNRWEAISKKEVPQRSYVHEFLFTILVPMFIMTLLAVLLSLILCFHHEGMDDPLSEDFFDNLYHICTDSFSSKRMEQMPKNELTQYAAINKATYTLRSLSNQRHFICLSPESVTGSRSHTNSPTSTINRGLHCRPSPPPYVKPKFSSDF